MANSRERIQQKFEHIGKFKKLLDKIVICNIEIAGHDKRIEDLTKSNNSLEKSIKNMRRINTKLEKSNETLKKNIEELIKQQKCMDPDSKSPPNRDVLQHCSSKDKEKNFSQCYHQF